MSIFFTAIRRHWISITVVTIVALGVSVGLSAVQPYEYRSSLSLLVIERNTSTDAFAAAKSAERASLSLAQILYTSDFYDRVRGTGLLGNGIFPDDEQERRESWAQRIETRALPDVGLLKISAFHEDQNVASQLAYAVATVLAKNGTDYLGSGKNIVLKVVDAPLTSKTPVRPNVPLNLAFGALLGFGATLAFHLVRDVQTHMQRDAAPVRTVNQELQPQQKLGAPPIPVITTMLTPNALNHLRPAQQERPQAPAPEEWTMPEFRA